MNGIPETVRRVVIRGRVQAVGFRAFVEYTARDRRIAGWVRNRRDGSVEALFAGEAVIVEAMIEACRRGPPAARVDAVDTHEGAPSDLALRPQNETFSVLPTM